MALVLRRRIPRIKKSSKRSKVGEKVAKKLKNAWESPEDYEPQI